MEWTIHDLRPGYWAFLALAALVLAGLARVSSRLPSPWRLAARGLVVFLFVRLLALENPWAWTAYERALEGRRIGWRQMDVIRQEIRSFLDFEPVRYLAVGTSQTAALYARIAEERSDLDLLTLGGMFPLDLVVWEERIRDRRPRSILLYASVWDLANKHEPEHLALSPPQRFRLPRLASRILALPGGVRYRRALVEVALGEVFPEFKHAFVFRGLVSAATGAAPRVGPPPQPDAADFEAIDRWAQNFQHRLSEETLTFHESFLRTFIRNATADGIRVVLVEGRLIPRAEIGNTTVLAGRVSEILRRIAADHPEVVFIPLENQPELTDEDFVDLTHVRPEAGLRFAREIVARLDAAGIGE